MIDLKNCTFIIPIRIESEDRLRNIITILAFLLENFDTNIIVKEVDKESIYENTIFPILTDILDVDININYIFEQNSSQSFHRQRILNEMLNLTSTKVVVNYDCDVILPIKSYINAYDMVIKQGYDLVYPYGFGSYQRKVNATDEIVSNFLEKFDYNFLDSNSNLSQSEYGWVQFFNRKSYIDGGMENENFISYSPEDKERFYRFSTLGYNVGRIDNFVYHLEHKRGINSWFSNPHMNENNLLWEKLKKMTKEELVQYYITQSYLKKYNG